MTEKPEGYLSEFIESVDDMIGRHFASDAELKIRGVIESDPKNWQAVEEILYRLIRSSITHARNQVQGRKCGTMTLDEGRTGTLSKCHGHSAWLEHLWRSQARVSSSGRRSPRSERGRRRKHPM